MRSLEAVCVTSSEIKRTQILFHEESGLIESVGDLGIPRSKLDDYFIYRPYQSRGKCSMHARVEFMDSIGFILF